MDLEQEEQFDTPAALLEMEPSTWRTLALAAHHLIEPGSVSLDELRQAVHGTLTEIITGYFDRKVLCAEAILPWLDLPNVLFGEDGAPWSMLRSVGDFVRNEPVFSRSTSTRFMISLVTHSSGSSVKFGIMPSVPSKGTKFAAAGTFTLDTRVP